MDGDDGLLLLIPEDDEEYPVSVKSGFPEVAVATGLGLQLVEAALDESGMFGGVIERARGDEVAGVVDSKDGCLFKGDKILPELPA
jgi:hypothetical protein